MRVRALGPRGAIVRSAMARQDLRVEADGRYDTSFVWYIPECRLVVRR